MPRFRPAVTSLDTREVPASLADVTDAIVHGSEYLNREVDQEYRAILNRPADTGGQAYWVNQLASGQSKVPQLEAALVGSDEFFNAHGGTNDLDVYFTYTTLLNRPADPSILAYWRGQLAAGLTRAGFAGQIAGSIERSDDTVNAYYAADLGRAASPLDRSFWVPALQAGQTVENFAATVLSSPEFQALHYGKLANSLNAIFLKGLGRAPDAGGFSNFLTSVGGETVDGMVTSGLYAQANYNPSPGYTNGVVLSMSPTIAANTNNGVNPADFTLSNYLTGVLKVDFATNDAARSASATSADRVTTEADAVNHKLTATVDGNATTAANNFFNAGTQYTITSGNAALTFIAGGTQLAGSYTFSSGTPTTTGTFTLGLA